MTDSIHAREEGEEEVPVASGHDETDFGFGRVFSQNSRGRLISRDGHPSSRKYGLGNQWAERFYLARSTRGGPSSRSGCSAASCS